MILREEPREAGEKKDTDIGSGKEGSTMAFMDNLRDKINTTSKDVSDKAQNVAAQTKLKAQITAEENKLKGLYMDLGKACYENPEDESIEVYKDSITAVKGVIAGYQSDLAALKGQKICPNCGAIIPKNALFCGQCGTKCEVVEEAEPDEAEEVKHVKVCPVCQAEVTDDMAFCEVCGAKLDD